MTTVQRQADLFQDHQAPLPPRAFSPVQTVAPVQTLAPGQTPAPVQTLAPGRTPGPVQTLAPVQAPRRTLAPLPVAAPMASWQTSRGPATEPPLGMPRSVVQRLDGSLPDVPSPEPPPPAEAPPAPADAAAAPVETAAAAAPEATTAAALEPEELLKSLYEPLLRRLKTELRLDRERRGTVADLPTRTT
jgi:hypothetical protein